MLSLQKLEDLLRRKEGIDIEFKTSFFELNKNTFESVCAFLNRQGGHLLLGVNDQGLVEGILEDSLHDITNNIVTTANNPKKLNPPVYLSPEVIDYNNKKIIYVYVPESSQVHRVNERIFDRNKDGDLDITHQPEQVTQLFLRKQTTYTENQVYAYLQLSDFKKDLFDRVRQLAKNQRAGHPWQDMVQ